MKGDSSEIVSYIAIAVIVISLFFIGMNITGHALVETGIVNVTIESAASINFETALLDLGNGTVTPGQAATVASEPATNAYWSGTQATGELILENNGNVNVSFTLMSNKSAADFIGGTSPAFKVKVSQNETGSCGSTANFTSYQDITTSQQIACNNLGFEPTQDSIMIDAELTISDNAAGSKTVGVTATATAI